MREKAKSRTWVFAGMQIAVIEFARNVCGHADAHSTEMEPKTEHPAVIFMPEGSKTHIWEIPCV